MTQQRAKYVDPTPNNFPDDYDESKVDPRVKLRSESINGKMNGADVRGALAQGLEIAGVVATEATETASAADAKSTDTQNRLKDQLSAATDANDDLSEVTDARRPADAIKAYKTIGERMDNMPTNDDIGDALDFNVDIDDGVQEPFKTALEIFKKGVNSDTSILKIGLIQDLHFMRPIYNDEYGAAPNHGLMHIQHMGALTDKLDVIVYNGDNVHGREAKNTTLNRIKQVINTNSFAFGNIPTLWTIGNHDDNNVYFNGTSKVINTLSLTEMQRAFGVDKTYNYQDFTDQKVRVIVLDAFENPEIYNPDGSEKYNRSYNSVFSQTQLFWLATEALKVPAGYSVVIFMHCPPQGFSRNLPYDKYQDVNHDLLLGILRAFVAGGTFNGIGTNADYPANVSVDFTAQGAGALVGVICGHEHHDVDPQIIDGIRVIVRTCNLGAGVGRTLNTLTEDAFDVIEIDVNKRYCKLNRFGAGKSVEFIF